MGDNIRPFALTIAGFDPSGGAGLLADIKTMESIGVYGIAVCTSNTFQTGERFEGVRWLKVRDILYQLDLMLETYHFDFAKVGLIESLDVMSMIIDRLVDRGIKVIWDPVLTASAGFVFHDEWKGQKLLSILNRVFLTTPNIPEAKSLLGIDYENGLKSINNHLLIKGGHAEGITSVDKLYSNGKVLDFQSTRVERSKHGTGCVFSSAICGYLAIGEELIKSIWLAKKYIGRFIQSNQLALGYHYSASSSSE